MKRHNGRMFGILRQSIDLLAWVKEFGRRNPHNPYIEVMLQYYLKHPGCNKFKYVHTNIKWIDIDCIDLYLSGVWLGVDPRTDIKKKNMCSKAIGLHVENLLIILNLIIVRIGRGVYNHSRTKRIFTLTMNRIFTRDPQIWGKWLQPQTGNFANHFVLIPWFIP